MNDEGVELLHLVNSERRVPEDPPAVAGWLRRMCRAAARDLPADDVGVSLVSNDGSVLTAGASSVRSTLLEELQFTMGEGPCLAAYASREPVLVPDLGAAFATWPGYATAAYEHEVRAVFAFPMQVGTIRLGALDVYRDEVGELTPRAHQRATGFARVALSGLIEPDDPDRTVTAFFDDVTGTRFDVYQAQGMVMAQLDVEGDEAMLRLRAHAFVTGRSLAQVSGDVLDRALRLE